MPRMRGRARLAQVLVVCGLAAAGVLAFGVASASAAGTFFCSNNVVADAGLQGDINGGGTVTVFGTCRGNYLVPVSVTIQAGAPGATLNGNATGTVLYVAGGGVTLTLRGMRITNGNAGAGGGIFVDCCADTLNLQNSVVTGNTAGEGGGIFIFDGTMNAVASTISNNSGEVGGGGIFGFEFVFINLTNSSVTGNTAPDGSGGGIFGLIEVFVTMTGTTVSRNSALFSGGGIFLVEFSSLNATASTIASNVTGTVEDPFESNGGGIWADFSPVTLTSTRVSWNTAVGYGGGIWFGDGDINFDTAPPTGGAPITAHAGHFKLPPLPALPKAAASVIGKQPPILPSPGLNVVSSTVDHNTVTFGAGGGIANESCEENSTATLTGSTVAFNRTTGDDLDTDSGGGGYVQYGNDCEEETTASLVATQTSFGGNLAKSSVGGAIFNVNYGPEGGALVTLAQSPTLRVGFSLNDNQALWGGGIFNFGDGASVALQPGAHIVHNQAFVSGGAVFNDCDATLSVAPGVGIMQNTPNQVVTNLGPCMLD